MALSKITDKQVTYKQGGTGSVLRNVGDTFRDVVSVKDFGASTSETGANNKTYFDAAWAASDPKAVLVPAGTYTITGTVTGKFYSFGLVTINSGAVNTITNLVP
jgi:polygalacturonase